LYSGGTSSLRGGRELGRAVKAYNKATGSLERRVLPSARRFKDLGATTGDEIGDLEPIDESPWCFANYSRTVLKAAMSPELN